MKVKMDEGRTFVQGSVLMKDKTIVNLWVRVKSILHVFCCKLKGMLHVHLEI